jgi:hypothetical protein
MIEDEGDGEINETRSTKILIDSQLEELEEEV